MLVAGASAGVAPLGTAYGSSADMADSIGAAQVALASKAGTTSEAGFASVSHWHQARRKVAAVQRAVSEVTCPRLGCGQLLQIFKTPN